MPPAAVRATLTQKEADMEVLWTTIAYLVVGGGALLAAYILFKWMSAARH
jgi:hypothetical protein